MLESLSANHYRLHGAIDMQESSVLLRELLALPATVQGQRLTLDISPVTSADSLLLAALLDLQRKLASRGASLQVQGFPDSLQGLARVYGIESLFEPVLLPAVAESA